MRLFPRLVCALIALTLLAPAVASAKVTAKVGIADQKADMFGDQRFKSLNIKLARRSVAWDVMSHPWQVAELDRWMEAARADGVTPLITFARSRDAARRHKVPTAAQIRSAFVAFRKRYPWAKEFVASNESNHYGEPTGRRPKLAAQWYKAMKSACPSCKIAAATLLDYPNLVSWTKAFVKAAGHQPKYWALHNYISANRFDLARTKQFLAATKGQIWITEVGGAVKRPRGQAKFKEGTKHAADVTRFVFGDIAPLSSRISRIYIYHWNADRTAKSWDSGLVAADGRSRPALTVLQQVMRGVKIKPLRKRR